MEHAGQRGPPLSPAWNHQSQPKKNPSPLPNQLGGLRLRVFRWHISSALKPCTSNTPPALSSTLSPSGVFTANAAWLVLAVLAFNLTRAAATITGTGLAKATTATIRRKIVSIPARIASSARRLTLHLPRSWPWQQQWTALFNHAHGPPTTTMT